MTYYEGPQSLQQMFGYFPERGVMGKFLIGDHVIFRQTGHDWSGRRGVVQRTKVVTNHSIPSYQAVTVKLPTGIIEGPSRFFYLDN